MSIKKIIASVSSIQRKGVIGVLFMLAIGVIISFAVENHTSEPSEYYTKNHNFINNTDTNTIVLGVCHHNNEVWVEDIGEAGKYICRCINGESICKFGDSDDADNILDEYYESIDYSCKTDSDCTIKDIRNCCGYYPKCVNVNSRPNQELVINLCEISESMAICGFQTINRCRCIDDVCQGTV